ncbi:MAG: GNAT family N-acetyltransferase [Burkholderiales bacterium]|nr:GNAT family N-acetyltransferase [Bacteroidia bacterium]
MLNIKQKLIKTLHIDKASEADFELIKHFICAFDLDNRGLKCEQFLVAKENDELLGFGRIRKHQSCDEFCSLGVIETKRFSGIAKALIEARIKIATQPIYLVCIIPEYFEKLGFVIVNNYPAEIGDKLNYCISELTVPENYVVMKYSD